MQPAYLIAEFRKILPGNSLANIISALRQDQICWNSLLDEEYFQKVRSFVGEEIERWSLSALALFASGYENRQKDAPVPEAIVRFAAIGKSVLKFFSEPAIQDEMLLAALVPTQEHLAFWAAVTAKQPDQIAFLKSTLDRFQNESIFDLVVHSVLCLPLSQQEQLIILYTLTQNNPILIQSGMVQSLKKSGREQQAALLARDLLAKSLPSYPLIFSDIHENSLTEASRSFQWAALYHIAGNVEMAQKYFNQAREISSRWAEAVSLNISDNDNQFDHPIKAFGMEKVKKSIAKQAPLDLIPSENPSFSQDPWYKIRLAKKIASTGDQKAAQTLAGESAVSLLTELNSGNFHWPDFAIEWTPVEIVKILRDLKLFPQAVDVLEAMLRIFPGQEDLLEEGYQLSSEDIEIQKALNLTHLKLISDPNNSQVIKKNANLWTEARKFNQGYDAWKDYLLFGQELDVSDQINFAQCALGSGRVEEALEKSLAVLELQPDQGQAAAILGQAYYLSGEQQEALTYLSQATLLAPDLPDAWLGLSKLYRDMGDSTRSIETLKSALIISPEEPETNLALANGLFLEGLITEALPYLDKAAQLMPDSKEVSLKLGKSLHLLGRLEEAHQVLKSGREKWAGDVELTLEHAKVLNECGNRQTASELLKIVLQAGNNTIDNFLLYVETILPVQSWLPGNCEPAVLDEAYAVLQKALAYEPDNFRANLLYAEVIAAKDEFQDALRIYQRINEKPEAMWNGWHGRVQGGMGIVALYLGQVEPALVALKEAAQENPDDIQLLCYLAQAYVKTGLNEDALQIANGIIDVLPDDIQYLLWYARLAQDLNQQTLAIQALEHAVQVSPLFIEGWIELVNAYWNMGQQEDLKNALKTILSNDGLTIKNLQSVAALYLRLDDRLSAIDCLQRALNLNDEPAFDLIFQIAYLKVLIGKEEEAMAMVRQAGQIEKLPLVLGVFMADLCSFLGQTAEAIDIFENVFQAIGDANQTISLLEDPLVQEIIPLQWIESISHPAFIELRMAVLYRTIGNLSEALRYSSVAVEKSPEDIYPRVMAADLARQMLDDEQAIRLLTPIFENRYHENSKLLEAVEGNRQRVLTCAVCLAGEIYLDQNNIEAAMNMFDFAIANLPDHPRLVALQSRLRAKQGDFSTATQLFLQAKASLEPNLTSGRQSQVCCFDIPSLDIFDSHKSWLSEAALSVYDWQTAITILDQAVEKAPTEPFIFLLHVRVLVLCAEREHLCRELMCTHNAPVNSVLDVEHIQKFSSSIAKIVALSHSREVDRWKARGEAAFNLNETNVKNLGVAAKFPQDTGVLMAALRQIHNSQMALSILDRLPGVQIDPIQAGLCYLEIDPERGIQTMQNAILNGSLSPEVYAVLAMLLEKERDTIAALEALEKALSFWPDEAEWQFWAADLALLAGYRDAAFKHLEKAYFLTPERAEYAFRLGAEYLKQNEALKAIDVFDRVRSLKPEMIEPWLGLARAHLLAGDMEKALIFVEKAQEIGGATADPYLLLSEIYSHNGQVQKAQEAVQKALNIHPDHPQAVIQLAGIMADQGKILEGIATLEMAALRNPGCFELQLEKTRLIKAQKGNEAALELARNLNQQFPGEPEALTILAETESECGNIVQAETAAREALRIEPGLPKLSFLMGKLKRQTGNLDQAVDYLNEAVQYSQEDLEPYMELAQTYVDRREPIQALNVYHRAIKINPNDPRSYFYSALVLRDMRDYLEAERMLRRAAELAPQDLTIRRQLGAVIALNLVHNSQEVGYPL